MQSERKIKCQVMQSLSDAPCNWSSEKNSRRMQIEQLHTQTTKKTNILSLARRGKPEPLSLEAAGGPLAAGGLRLPPTDTPRALPPPERAAGKQAARAREEGGSRAAPLPSSTLAPTAAAYGRLPPSPPSPSPSNKPNRRAPPAPMVAGRIWAMRAKSSGSMAGFGRFSAGSSGSATRHVAWRVPMSCKGRGAVTPPSALAHARGGAAVAHRWCSGLGSAVVVTLPLAGSPTQVVHRR